MLDPRVHLETRDLQEQKEKKDPKECPAAKELKARLDKKEDLVDLELWETKETKAMPENSTPPKVLQVPLDQLDPLGLLGTLDQLDLVERWEASDLLATLDQKVPLENLAVLDSLVHKDPLEHVVVSDRAINAQLHEWRLDIRRKHLHFDTMRFYLLQFIFISNIFVPYFRFTFRT